MSDPDPVRLPSPESADSDATAAYQQSDAPSELVKILDQYLADLQAGCAPERAKLLAEHASLAPQLEQCLAGIEFIDRAGRPGPEAPAQLGDFRILREVGRGGMGVVYEAEQLSLKRKVALKVLRFGGVADQDAMERFQREAETVARMHHTNIVPIFAIGDQQGVFYYAMQFIEGQSLAAVLDQSQKADVPLDPIRAARWGMQAAEALAHAHQRGVIHRDMKPSNLILDPEGQIWLTDFGLAKRIDDVRLSMTGALLGTPRYMSPEQASAAKLPVDQRTDIYSLGATLYELATGKPVFEAGTPAGVITQILTTDPQPPRRLRPNLPRDLETIILKCIVKEPAQRYQTAQGLADDLRAFAEGRAIKARRPRLVERTVRWVRKQRRSVALAGGTAVAAVLLVVGAILGWQWRREAQMGQIQLTTDGPSLVADVLDANDEPVVPSFPVPTPEPVTLPAGSYQLRLSAPGVLSQTWPLEVERKGRNGLLTLQSVRLEGRWLWPPAEIKPAQPPEPIDLTGRTDLIVTEFVQEPYSVRLRRLDGATGKPVWASDLVLDDKNLPAGANKGEWTSLLHAAMIGNPSLLRPAPELDGDGTRDLVWACRNSPSLLAVSGKDGKVLWWFRARPRLREAADMTSLRPFYPINASVLGEPIAADVDGDGTPDLIACFVSAGEKFADQNNRQITAEPQEWVEAVSGRTGKSLWRYAMDKRWLDGKYSCTSGSSNQDFNLNCVLGAVRLNGQPVVAIVAGKMLLGLDLKTGKEAWPPEDLGFDRIGLPEWADLDGDGQSELLLLRPNLAPQARGRYFSPGRVTELLLSAVSLSTRQPIWETALRPALTDLGGLQQSTPERPAVYWVADLDQDGKPEVMIPVGRHGGSWHWDAARNALSGTGYERRQGCWSGVEVLDGATGTRRWQRPLWYTGANHPPTIHGAIAGPDLDGDGHRELFVAAAGHAPGLEKGALTVVAISTAEGRVLWRWRQPGSPYKLRSLHWWQAGMDGWPQLVVPAESGPGGQPVTYVVSAATGRLVHVLAEVCTREVADFNSDGIADLFNCQFFSAASQYRARLAVIPGALPEPWRQFGSWRPAQDLDGDGFTDLVQTRDEHQTARSGRDGRRLWQTGLRTLSDGGLREMLVALPLPEGDLDGDGAPDFVRFDMAEETVPAGGQVLSTTWFRTVSAFSGKDGRRLWRAPDFSVGNSSGSGGASYFGLWVEYRYPTLDWCDLDGDRRAEVLVTHMADNQAGTKGPLLTLLSGHDGSRRWSVPFASGTFGLRGFPCPPSLGDLNGDGVLDLVLWVPGGGQGDRQLRAYSGQDGRELWPPGTPLLDSRLSSQCVPAAVGDLDGDGLAEVVVAQVVVPTASGRQGPDRFPRGEAMALGGRDAERKWTWSWPSQPRGLDILPPRLVDIDGKGRRAVCLGLHEKDVPEIVVLGADGQLRGRIPLKPAPGRLRDFSDALRWWNHYDLDGDGREELLFASDGHLWASRGTEQETLWKWPIPLPGEPKGYAPGPGEIVEIQPAGKDRPAVVVVWAGNVVYGLAGPTGLVRWRCDVPWAQPSGGFSSPPTAQLLATDDPAGLPRILCRWGSYSLDLPSTTLRQAWPIGPDGRYQAPMPVALSYEPEPVLAPPGRPLPWAGRGWSDSLAPLALGVACFVVVVIPGFLVYRFAGSHAWAAGLSAIVYGMLALLALGASKYGSVALPLAMLLALAVPGQLMVAALRRKSLSLWLLTMTAIAASLGTLLYEFRTSSRPGLRDLGTLYYLGRASTHAAAWGIAALPTVFLIFVLVGWFRRGAWKNLALLLGWSVVLAAVIGCVSLLEDSWRAWQDPSEPYSWAGWYLVWPLGVYAAAALMLVWVVLKAGWRLLRRAVRRVIPQARAA